MSNLSAKDFRILLQHKPVGDILQLYLFDRFPVCFAADKTKYHLLRRMVCDYFQIHPQNFALVGSGKMGFSLSPERFGTPFGSSSDLDIILVSDELFQQQWISLIEYERKSLNFLDPVSRKRLKDLKIVLFYGQLRFDKVADSFPFSKKWWEFFNTLSIDERFGPRRVRAALFKSWHHASNYYERGLSQLKETL